MTCMHQGCYFTYIVASRSRTLYIGVTGDLHKRVFEHKWKEHEGFTARYNCDRRVWFESHEYVQKAIAREKELQRFRSCCTRKPRSSSGVFPKKMPPFKEANGAHKL